MQMAGRARAFPALHAGYVTAPYHLAPCLTAGKNERTGLGDSTERCSTTNADPHSRAGVQPASTMAEAERQAYTAEAASTTHRYAGQTQRGVGRTILIKYTLCSALTAPADRLQSSAGNARHIGLKQHST